jgi:RNA polymerase sigma factor (sigma-70 family)
MTDLEALTAYADRRDADAFRHLVSAYQRMVHGVCRRVLGSASDAEDATQDTFIRLARSAGQVTSNPASWLHACASNVARDAQRSEIARKDREKAWAEMKEIDTPDDWDELLPLVDGAIAELPDDDRELLLQYYFASKTQADLAGELGITQQAVAKRLEKSVGQLRERMKEAGVAVSVALLTSFLTSTSASAAVPAALTASLVKIGLAGVGKSAVVATTATVAVVKLKVAAVIAASVIAVGGMVAYKVATTPNEAPLSIAQKPVESRKGSEVPKNIDYSKLVLKADHWRDDSFSLVIQAVARMIGQDADYETVFALSTNGFAPGITTNDPECRATWRMFGRGRNMETVAAYLGLSATRLNFPAPPPLPEPDADGRKWGTPAYSKWLDDRKRACAAVIRKTLDAGSIVITDGGWRNHEWFLWGIITEARPDGTIIGTTLSPPLAGNLDYCVMDHIRSYWVVTATEARLPQEEADVAMLRRAVARIRGNQKPFLPGEVVFGTKAMDRWIAQMEKPAFQEGDPASSAGNARVNADVSSHGAVIVAAYLRRRMGSFPQAARPHLEAVANHYDRVAELLKPFAVREDGEGYHAMMGKTGDLVKQKVHAEEVLVPVKTELAAAADEMEKVLAAVARKGLTDDDLARLGQWGNIFGREKTVEAADNDPAFYELLKLELSLAPVSSAAKRLRGALGRMEPAELTYAAQLNAVFGALASGDVPDDIMVSGGFRWDSPLWDARKARRAELAGELRQWIDDGAGRLAEDLGERNDDKLRLARLVLHEFENDDPDAEAIETLRGDATLGDFAHRIEMLDGEPWSHERNFDLLVRGIGKLRPVGEWHTLNGPLAWGDAAPGDKPKVEAMRSKLNSWLAGGEDADLGARDAYPEKVWLARCLATYLRYHLKGYWRWMDRRGAERMELNGRGYELKWVSPRNLEELRLVGPDSIRPRAPRAQYGDHAHPLYNIHCEIGPAKPTHEYKADLDAAGKTWPEHWQDLAEGLDVDYFALIAIADGKLAGYVRFFPADIARLRGPDEHQVNARDVLAVGNCYVDAIGADDELDVELLRRVTKYASGKKYASIRAFGWSDIRAFAMWGETFPVSIFTELGFRKIATTRGDEGPLNDMLAGAHGPWVKEQVTAAMVGDMTKEKATELFVVELALPRHAEVKREGERMWIEGVPPERPVEGIWHFDGSPASLRAALEFKGVEAKYLDDTVFAAILGQPFRFWFSRDFASCLAYTHEEQLGVIAADTLGFDHVWHQGGYGKTSWEAILSRDGALDGQGVKDAWAGVKRELDSGNPVIVFGGSAKPDPKAAPLVVTGYDDERDLMFFVPQSTWNPAPAWDEADAECAQGIAHQGYRARKRPNTKTWIGSGFAPAQGMGGAAASFFAFGDRVRNPSEHEVAVSVLRRAVAIGRGEVFDNTRPNRKGGLKAFDLLAATLEGEGEIVRGDPDWWYAMEGLAWPPFRKTAAAFVSRCATDFGAFNDAQKVDLLAAAQSYEKSAAQFDALWQFFLSVGPLEEYDERVKTVATVLASRDLRTKAAGIVRRIRAAEEEAIAEIEKALAAM